MKYDSRLKPEFVSSGFEIKNPESVQTSVSRTEEHLKQLIWRTTKEEGVPYLSSTAINTWLFCRMKFFYRYVNGIGEHEAAAMEIDPAMLGTLLHDILKKFYEPLIGHTIKQDQMSAFLHDRNNLNRLIDQSLAENYKHGDFPFTAVNELIVRDVLMTYIERVLNTDREYSPFIILGVEKPFRFMIKTGTGSSSVEIVAGGRIDRIDIKEGVTRIVDYKTGSVGESIGSIEDLFEDDRDKNLDGWLQALFYCEGYNQSDRISGIIPSIYNIKKAAGNLADVRLQIRHGRSETETVDNYDPVRQQFMKGLETIIQAIFSKDEPFNMTSKIWNKCGYCPYRVLCMR